MRKQLEIIKTYKHMILGKVSMVFDILNNSWSDDFKLNEIKKRMINFEIL